MKKPLLLTLSLISLSLAIFLITAVVFANMRNSIYGGNFYIRIFFVGGCKLSGKNVHQNPEGSELVCNNKKESLPKQCVKSDICPIGCMETVQTSDGKVGTRCVIGDMMMSPEQAQKMYGRANLE